MIKAIKIVLLLLWGGGLWAQRLGLNDSVFNLKQIYKIALRNCKGQPANLFQDKVPLNLFVFLSPECPLCKNYSLVLNQLHSDYKKQVDIYGLVPGKAYTPETVAQFKKEYKIAFPLYIDEQKNISGYLKATVTPEVVLLNSSGKLIYRGAIDDWVTELGKTRTRATNEYLREAVFQYLHQQPVAVKRVAPKGCLINEY